MRFINCINLSGGAGFIATRRDLGIYRIIFSVYLIFAVLPIAPELPDTPNAFYSPSFSFAALFSTFPPHLIHTFLNLLLGLSACLLLIGFSTRFASLGAGVILLILKSFEYAIGKINHDLPLVLIPLVMAFSAWGKSYSVDAARAKETRSEDGPSHHWCLSYLALLLGISMFVSGWEKLTSGWLNPDTFSTYGHLVSNYLQVGREAPLVQVALRYGASPLWELADWTATILELAFLAACFHGSCWRVIIALATLFHVGVWMLFDIVFDTNVLAYGLFVPYSRILQGRVAVISSMIPSRVFFPGIGAIALGAAGFSIWKRATFASILSFPISEAVVSIGALLVFGFTAAVLRRVFNSKTEPSPGNVTADDTVPEGS